MAGKQSIFSRMASRYANALFELALDTDAIATVKPDLDKFDALATGSADLTRLMRSPVFSAEEQLRAIDAVLERAGIGGLAAKFLKMVTSNRRLFTAREMIQAFRELVDRHNGEVTAEVTAAETLNEARLTEIRDALRSATAKNVNIDVRVDPAIIGGLIVKLGSRMVDSSLRSKLNSIQRAMKEAS